MNKKSLFALASIATAIPTIANAQSEAPTFLQENKLAIAIMVVAYLGPSLIAYNRKHPAKGSIIAINILLGWTGIGWLVSFIWSLGSTRHNVVVVNPSSVAAIPQTASTALPLANKTIGERISDLKTMLDAGTISQSEFEALKADAMKGLA